MIGYLRLALVWIAELFRSMPLPRRRRRRAGDFLLIGHRGAPFHAAENTMTSFQLALEQGANALEMDLCLTADSEVVLWHDWDPTTLLARVRAMGLEPRRRYIPNIPDDDRRVRPVDELTLEQLREWYGYVDSHNNNRPAGFEIPTFEDFVRWAVGLRQDELKAVFLDVKIPPDRLACVDRFTTYLVDVMSRYNFATRTIVETYHPEVVQALRERLPNLEYSIDVEPPLGVVLDPSAYSSVRLAIEHSLGCATLGRPRAATAAPFVTHRRAVQHDLNLRRRHNRGNPDQPIETVVAYTINEKSEMQTLIRMGVDGIQTDNSALLHSVARKERVLK